MKWFLAALCVVAGGAIGYVLRMSKKKHVKVLSDLSVMCDIMDKNIDFTHHKVSVILQEIKSKVGKEIFELLTTFEKLLGSAQQESELKKACAKTGLKAEEAASTVALLNAFGKTDAKMQREMLSMRKKELDAFLVGAQEDYRKNSKLYLELGILLGIGVGILLI